MNQNKCYKFEFIATEHGYGYVYAHDKEEAIKYASINQYDEIMDKDEFNIEEVISIEELEENDNNGS